MVRFISGLVFSLLMLPDLNLDIFKEWLSSGRGAIPMALLVVTAFKHGLDGLKVVVDDYVHDEGTRIGLHYFLAMLAIGGASVALFALARIVFGAAA